MQAQGTAQPAGALGLVVHRGDGRVERLLGPQPVLTQWPDTLKLEHIVEHAYPKKGLSDEVNTWRRANRRHFNRIFKKVLASKALKLPTVYGALWLDIRRGTGEHVPLGLASVALVTDTGVAYIVDAFQNIVELENMKFHGFGTGSTAENASQTALVTELTTEYATDNTRPTGPTIAGATANLYRTVATLDPDADVNLREHGIFSQAAVAGGVMLDRSLFASINLVGATGDTLQATYDFTITSGG